MFYKPRKIRPDTTADIEWRIRQRAAGERALADMRIKFPKLTPDNFARANEYREHRIAELMDIKE